MIPGFWSVETDWGPKMKVNFEDYRDGVRMVLKLVAKKKPILAELYKEIDQALVLLEPLRFQYENLLPAEIGNSDFRKAFIKDLVRMYTDEHGVLVKTGKVFGKENHKPWVEEEIKAGRLKFTGYDLYRDRLSDKGFNDDSLKAIDETTTNVLDRMGNPKVDYAFKTYGLLMGDVQSGKTATFTGICHKAVDAGYRFIIVLSGTKRSLRTQTQNRLDDDLVGMKTDSRGRKAQSFTQNQIIWNQLTTSEFDFEVSKLDNQISPDNPRQVSLAVTQKNKKVLENILTWLDRVQELGVNNLPFLLIDDEADAASINVAEMDRDPTTINGLIRKILDRFDRAAYLAVTATPFANVFIDPQLDPSTGQMRQDVLPDLFPRDYIYPIPTPDGYLGVDRLFGDLGEIEENSPKYRSVIPLSLDDDSDGEEVKVYNGRLRANDRLDKLPNSLRRAVLYFLCVCTLKDMTDLKKSNTSMLVHIARYKSFQSGLKNLIENLVEHLTQLAEVESKRPTKDILDNELYQELESLWNDGCGNELWYDDPTHGTKPPTLRELSGFEWKEVWRRRFGEALVGVKVVEANTNSKIKNFEVYYEKNDAKLITVGGDALSRGLTLEGLCVSYFSRRSFAYDTLLQMGRWFGYRESMKSYMKIWISDCLVEAYGYVAEAMTEFRETVERMRIQRASPQDFGLRIRRAPKSVKLMVTAANKRRTSTKIRALLDMTRTPFQASALPRSEEDLEKNRIMMAEFLSSLGPVCTGSAHGDNNDLVWTDVESSKIGALLQKFIVYSWSDDLDIGSVARKIIERNEPWMVRVVSLTEGGADGGRRAEDVFGLGEDMKVVCPSRTMIDKKGWIQPKNRSLLSPADFCRHWSAEKRRAVLDEINSTGGDSPKRRIEPWMVLSQPDEKPQLLIYPLRSINEHSPEAQKKLEGKVLYKSDNPFVSMVFGIPGDGSKPSDSVYVEYDTNRIYQMLRDSGYDDGDEE